MNKIIIQISDDLNVDNMKLLITAFLSNEDMLGKFKINTYSDIVWVVDYMNECVAIFTTIERAKEYISKEGGSYGYCIMPVKLNDYDGLYKDE